MNDYSYYRRENVNLLFYTFNLTAIHRYHLKLVLDCLMIGLKNIHNLIEPNFSRFKPARELKNKRFGKIQLVMANLFETQCRCNFVELGGGGNRTLSTCDSWLNLSNLNFLSVTRATLSNSLFGIGRNTGESNYSNFNGHHRNNWFFSYPAFLDSSIKI